MKSVVDSGKETIGAIVRSGSKDIVQVHITEAVATYVSLLSNSKGIPPQAIITIGKLFTENDDLKHLTISELKTFLHLAFVKQQYGKLYGGFGYDVLIEWWNTFLDDRHTDLMRIRENQHRQHTTFEKQRRGRTEGDAFGSIKSFYKGGDNEQR